MTFPNGNPDRQSGAALVVGLVLLLVLTILAVATMNTASLEVAMASNNQNSQNAFQMAETGIDLNLATADNNRALLVAVVGAPQWCLGVTNVADVGTYNGCHVYTGDATALVGSSVAIGGGLAAYHFNSVGAGTSFRGAQSNHLQSFYVPGPGGGN
ncbi:MAG: PilX N-terminal domain-containing pilus assembly protein [Gammaproteobacteria bacterium]|jgi:type IV pilus assembly protein PilX